MFDNNSERSNDTASSDINLNIYSLKTNLIRSKNNYQENLLKIGEDATLKKILIQIDYYDKFFSNYIHEIEVNMWLEKVIYIFARIFNTDLIILFYVLLFLYQYIVNKNEFFVIKPLIHVFIIFVLTGILKYTIKRPRPEINEKVKRKYNVRKKETNHSMPSGDSMQAGNFAIIILFYFKSYYGFIIIPFVMFARIFYFCHYILDTVVGAIIGIGVSYILVYPLNLIKIK